MNKTNDSHAFLVIGKAQESVEASEGFKRYVGVGSSFIKAVNPTKKELDEIMGYESSFDPVYVNKEDESVNIHFIVETNPDTCNGISIKTKAMFTLRLKPALSSDGNTVQIIDDYGNYSRMNYEDAKAHKPVPASHKIDQATYRIACEGEVDLTVFLKKFLNIPNSLDYSNGSWVVKKDAAENAKFKLENIKDYFKGDFSELKEALAYQPNNTIKLLYGVKTKDDGKQIQVVCTEADLTMRNSANASVMAQVERDLANAKAHNKYSKIDYRICELQEYTVEPTNLAAPAAEADQSNAMPWD